LIVECWEALESEALGDFLRSQELAVPRVAVQVGSRMRVLKWSWRMRGWGGAGWVGGLGKVSGIGEGAGREEMTRRATISIGRWGGGG